MPKIIGFLGSYPADICLYAAFALQNTGQSVCVIDHSKDGALYRCIPTPDRQLAVVTYHNVDFMRQEPFANWQDMDYQYVFVQLGQEPEELCLAVCSERVLVIDCERRNLDFYNRYMQENQLSMLVLLRGVCPDGVSAKKIKERLECENCFVEKWMTLPLDEMDEAYRIGMQYERMGRFAHISMGMEKVLAQLLHMVVDYDYMGILRAVRAAKYGRIVGRKRA